MTPPEDREDGTAVLVGTGSFRIDRKQALSKLMRFQLPDPGMYLLLLVRCAVASGAAYVRVEGTEGNGVRVRFNGRPFDAAAVSNPYASLFARTTETARRDREFAIALLSMLRLGPKWVTLQSGEGQQRFILRVESLESESIQPAADGSAETVIRAIPQHASDSSFWNEGLAELVRKSCDLSSIPVELDGTAIQRQRPEDSAPECLPFESEGFRGWLTLPSRPEAPSEFRLYRYGVWAGDAQERLPFVQVRASVNCDLFNLNASQSGVLRNERFRKALAVSGKQTERLLLRVAELQNASMGHTGRYILSKPLRNVWEEHLPANGPREAGLLAKLKKVFAAPLEAGLRSLADTVAQDARRTRWLREAATRLAGTAASKAPEPVRKALLEAGLFLGADAKPMSLTDILSQRTRIGYVPVTERPFPETAIGFMPVWLTSRHDAASLLPWIGDSLSAVTGYLETEGRRWRGADPSLSKPKPSFELLGVVNVLTRIPVSQEGLEGEIALASHRPADGARIHVFRDAGAISHSSIAGPLRFVAVLSGAPRSRGPQAAEAAALAAVPSLYRRAAEEYHPDWDLPRNNALREHLLDFIAWIRSNGKEPSADHPWAADARLFPHDGGLWSYSQMRRALSEDETLFFTRDPSKRVPAAVLFKGDRFSLDGLQALFPDAGVSAYPGVEGVFMVYPKLSCTAHGGDCLVEWSLGDASVHLAAGQGKGGAEVSAPWGACRVFGGPFKVPDEAGLALLQALLREGREGLQVPAHPLRKFALRALGYFFAPWPGKDLDSQRHRRLREILSEYPLFRPAAGSPWTLRRLDARMRSGRAGTDILLDEDELAAISALFPGAKDRLEPSRKAAKSKTPKPAKLSFPTPMLCQAQSSMCGMDVLVGLPPEPLPGLEVTVLTTEQSKRFSFSPPGLSLAGSFLIDARTFQGPVELDGALHPELVKIVLSVYPRFIRGVLDKWSSLSRAKGLFAYLLILLKAPAEGSRDPDASWEELRLAIRGLKAIPTLGTEPVSIEDLAGRAAADGALVYSPETLPSVPEDARGVPVLRYPRLTAQALGNVRLRTYVPLPPEEPVPAGPSPKDGSPEERILHRLGWIFAELRGARGIDPAGCPPAEAVSFVRSGQGSVVFSPGEHWELNPGHSSITEILSSGLSPEEQADYLSSIIYTEANRTRRSITDEEDLEFQTALAERLLREISCRTPGRPT
ncbi:MAG: hypothetical protein WC728_00890 [Elusimicrobiota bacterium]